MTLMACLAFGPLFFRPLAIQRLNLNLVSVPRDSGGAACSALIRLGLDVRQELGTCYLVLADRQDIQDMKKAGLAISVLDRCSAGRAYFLVSEPTPQTLAVLKVVGRAVRAEPGTIIFWSESGEEANAVLPGDMERKSLPARSILPYLSRPASFARTGPAALAVDAEVVSVVNDVSGPNLTSYVQALENFQTRYASTAACESAGDYIQSFFSSLGLDDVHTESFSFNRNTSRNIVAERIGEVYPDDILIICGHYDSTTSNSTRVTNAPGADDNASGTAAVMEAARIFASRRFDYSVRFIAFSAEEWGLYGSQAYAAAARARGDSIIGVINLDMIGYVDAVPEDLDIIVNDNSRWLAERLAEAASLYLGLSSDKIVDASITYSDHSSFWDRGYPALLGIEDDDTPNPYYHKTGDTLATLNPAFMRSAAASAIALLAELAQPVRMGVPATPTGFAVKPLHYRSLLGIIRDVRLTWTAQADAVGYNVYRSTESHLDYVKLNDAPLPEPAYLDRDAAYDRKYFYVVRAVGMAGSESNMSREEKVVASAMASVSSTGSSLLIAAEGVGL